MLFLVIYTYTVLVSPTPSWHEMYCIAYITTLGCEKVREIISSEPVAITYVASARWCSRVHILVFCFFSRLQS